MYIYTQLPKVACKQEYPTIMGMSSLCIGMPHVGVGVVCRVDVGLEGGNVNIKRDKL